MEQDMIPDGKLSTKLPRRPRKRCWRWVGGILCLLILFALLDFFLYPLLPMGGKSGNHAQNGLWLRYTWYFGLRSPEDMHRLSGRLREEQIRDAYFHVRYINSNGKLHFHYQASARRLTDMLHREAPGVRLFAWVYIGGEREKPYVDIGNPVIRQRIIQEAQWLLKDCGFDGIQWDYEVCHNNDQRLLALLKETRAALPAGTPLSVCTPPWLPAVAAKVYGWDSAYFGKVAKLCDQLTVMGYDTGIYSPHPYAAFLHQQVVQVTIAVQQSNPKCQVIIGVPTYAKGGASHFAYAENIKSALQGVRAGIADRRTALSVFAGVASFADYTTQADEWRVYQQYWLK